MSRLSEASEESAFGRGARPGRIVAALFSENAALQGLGSDFSPPDGVAFAEA